VQAFPLAGTNKIDRRIVTAQALAHLQEAQAAS